MNLKTFREELAAIHAHTAEELQTVRTGRASPSLVAHALVDSYGSKIRLQELASISIADPQTLLIQPWDPKSVKDVEHALQKSALGIQPVVDGALIRLTIPSLTEERRREYGKVVRGKMEEAKIASRRARDGVMQQLRDAMRDGALPEDRKTQLEKEITKEMELFLEKLQSLIERKEQELMNTS